jgi:TonB family protein
MLQIDRESFGSRPAHRGLGASLLLHIVAGTVLLSITLPPAVEHSHRITSVYLPRIPSPVRRRPVAAPQRPIPVRHALAIPQPIRPARFIEPPPLEAPVAGLPPAAVAAAQFPLRETFAVPKPIAPRPVEAATGLFESQRSMATSTEPAAKAQTGVFDSSTSVTAKPVHTLRPVPGFSDSAIATLAPTAPHSVSSAQFDAVSASPAARRTGPSTGVHEPIEILAKPRPIYTDEARRLRIEGEVILEVLFRASAQVCVLRVVKGLGHGLDASAENAAMGIRFHPAAEHGRAVDSVATVKIEFQLAD